MNDKNEEVTIIMVEDDEGHAKLIEKNLRRAGIVNKLIHYSDGAQAVEHFFGKEAPEAGPLLILLDLNLPGIDGYEILRRLKTNGKTKKIPIVVLTTTDNPREIEKCYELGCNVYMTKPVEYEAFAESIRKLGLLLAVVKVPHAE